MTVASTFLNYLDVNRRILINTPPCVFVEFSLNQSLLQALLKLDYLHWLQCISVSKTISQSHTVYPVLAYWIYHNIKSQTCWINLKVSDGSQRAFCGVDLHSWVERQSHLDNPRRAFISSGESSIKTVCSPDTVRLFRSNCQPVSLKKSHVSKLEIWLLTQGHRWPQFHCIKGLLYLCYGFYFSPSSFCYPVHAFCFYLDPYGFIMSPVPVWISSLLKV